MGDIDLIGILEFLIPVVLFIYGYRWLKAPPEFGSTKGIATKTAQTSQESWDMAHRFGGKLSIIFGTITLVVTIVKRFITDESLHNAMEIVSIILNIVLVFSLIPIVNIYVKKKLK